MQHSTAFSSTELLMTNSVRPIKCFAYFCKYRVTYNMEEVQRRWKLQIPVEFIKNATLHTQNFRHWTSTLTTADQCQCVRDDLRMTARYMHINHWTIPTQAADRHFRSIQQWTPIIPIRHKKVTTISLYKHCLTLNNIA